MIDNTIDNLKKIKEKYNYNFFSCYIDTEDENLKITKPEELISKIAAIADEVLENIDKNFVENECYPNATPIVTNLAEKLDINIHSKSMNKDVFSYLTVDRKNIDNFQTDRVIVFNSDNPFQRDIVFSIAYDVGTLLFDFSEDKDISYSFVFREKHENGLMLEDSWSIFANRETISHFFCYTFALFLIMPPNKFANDFKNLDKKDITLYDKGGILAEKYQTSSWLVGERVKIMELTDL